MIEFGEAKSLCPEFLCERFGEQLSRASTLNPLQILILQMKKSFFFSFLVKFPYQSTSHSGPSFQSPRLVGSFSALRAIGNEFGLQTHRIRTLQSTEVMPTMTQEPRPVHGDVGPCRGKGEVEDPFSIWT